MRYLSLVAVGCLLGTAPAAAQGLRPVALGAPVPLAVSADTTVRIPFDIPAQSVAGALGLFARQAGLRVEVDLTATSGARSAGVAGSYRAPEALRALLAETGLVARFPDGETVLVTAADAREGTAYDLTPLVVTAQRSRGYASTRTSSATRTDTPLRDVPQAVSVVTHQVIADQAMQGMSEVVRYVPGITMGQGEGHRDAPTIRGNSSTADFFVDGVRDDVQYVRDLYNVERVEALKGSNAMIFGRGGGGGVINRVSKEAQWAPTRELTLGGGSYSHRRGTVDVGQGVGPTLALRLAAMLEDSEGFREHTDVRRWGVNPTAAFALGARTTLRGGYEYFRDERTVDRGIPSFAGRPSDAGIRTFFGNPDSSYATTRVRSGGAALEHVFPRGVTLRNRTRYARYEKFYQNSFAGGAVSAAGSVGLSAYSNATDRENLFSQTDLTFALRTGPARHTLLAGADIGRQATENFRNTGYYNGTATSLPTPFAHPTVSTPIVFRQSATDADNESTAEVEGVFLQDQVELSRHWQAIAGVRVERFAVDFHNRRTDERLAREDVLVSPRGGLVFKPWEMASLYGSYSVSYLPSSGDQFSSLNATTETLEPEQFTNYEVGGKWDVRPSLSLTVAAYRLERSNTSAPDPNDAARTVQTGSQRTTGVELEATGNVTEAWQVIGGVAVQSAKITSTTKAAPAGRRVPLVPERTFSLWNRYQLLPAVGVGLGVVYQAEMFAAIDNTVTLPAFTRADAALYLRLGPVVGLQVNVENLLDERYYPTSHGNNNILPGAPRTLRLSLTTRP